MHIGKPLKQPNCLTMIKLIFFLSFIFFFGGGGGGGGGNFKTNRTLER